MKLRITQVSPLVAGVVLLFITGEISARVSSGDPNFEPGHILLAQESASPAYTVPIESPSGRDSTLVGHWRKTTIVFESPRDEHLVLGADGTVENWVVTASSQSATTKGTWNVEGKTLSLLLNGGTQISQPFTIHEGQLVFPNIPKRRGFWEKLSR